MSLSDPTRDIVERLRDCAEIDASEGAEPTVVEMTLQAASAIEQLRAALHDACDLLEGWAAYKSPKKYLAEHLAKAASLRAVATTPTPTATANPPAPSNPV